MLERCKHIQFISSHYKVVIIFLNYRLWGCLVSFGHMETWCSNFLLRNSHYSLVCFQNISDASCCFSCSFQVVSYLLYFRCILNYYIMKVHVLYVHIKLIICIILYMHSLSCSFLVWYNWFQISTDPTSLLRFLNF